MQSTLKHISLFVLILFSLASCQTGPATFEELLRGEISIKKNPFGKVPLGAQLQFSTKEKCTVKLTVTGKQPVSRTFSTPSQFHELPVLGLYPGTENTVEIELTSENGKVYQSSLSIQTEPIPDILPTIEITKKDKGKMEPGFHLIDMLIANNGKFLTYTILFDDNGDIRWFMDMSSTGQITYTSHRLKNGNWLYMNWIDLIEVDDLGKVVKEEKLWGFAGNHELLELPNGQILFGGSQKDAMVLHKGKPFPSRFDQVVIWDRKQNRPVKAWDTRQVLDVDRLVFPPDFSPDYQSDWFHLNTVDYLEDEGSVLISGRGQGVLKMDNNTKLEWILAPHKGWGKAGPEGKGFETSDYLLTAIDESGKPLPQAVQQGDTGTDEFEWSTGQHAVQQLENGNILMFDNGLMRNFDSKPTYSRAVEYKVDAANKTIQQVWEYGKARGLDMYSAITSDVDILPQTGNRLITAGNVRASQLPPHAKLIEITHPENEVIFEAQIFFKDALGTKERSWAQFDLVFRGERYDLIPK